MSVDGKIPIDKSNMVFSID